MLVRRRSPRAAASAVFGIVAALVAPMLPFVPVAVTPVASAAPAGDSQVVAFVARGLGNGHGRGLSQWGSYGFAKEGAGYRQIVDHYYRDTRVETRDGGVTEGEVLPAEATARAEWRAETREAEGLGILPPGFTIGENAGSFGARHFFIMADASSGRGVRARLEQGFYLVVPAS